MPTDINVLKTIDVIAIIVAVVSVVVSVLAFFASIIFFLRGQKLQEKATEALVSIQEKSAAIETQVGGMFDKTLSAAISKKDEVSEQFESLQQKLKESAEEIAKQVQKDIQGQGQEKVHELAAAVKKEFDVISAELKSARKNLDTTQIFIPRVLMNSPAARRILNELSTQGEMSLEQILKSSHSEAGKSLKLQRLNELTRLGLIIKKEDILGLVSYGITDKGALVARQLESIEFGISR